MFSFDIPLHPLLTRRKETYVRRHPQYQELLDKLRKKIALEHLKEPGPSSGDIAFLLGYSDQSAFNHAFKRWMGKTPQQFRL